MSDSPQTDEQESKPSRFSKARIIKEIRSWSGFGAFLVAVYFTSNLIQNRLGETAFNDTGLPSITLEQALVLAKEQNKEIVANLSAYWCGTCRKFDREVLSDPRINKTLTNDFIFARIDSESPEAAYFIERYKAKGYPTLIHLNKDGDTIQRLPLTFSPGQFLQALR